MSSGHRGSLATVAKIANSGHCPPAQYRVISSGKTWAFATLDACLAFKPMPRTSAVIQVNGRTVFHWSEACGVGGYIAVLQLAKCGT